MFSLVRALPSPISAEGCPSLFDRFIGTMAQSDSSETCRSAVRRFAFSDRSRSWLGREVPEVSRFSCMLLLSVRGFLDYAGPADHSRSLRDQPCCLPLVGDRVGALIQSFSELNSPAHRCPCLRFDRRLAASLARLRVRMESLSPFL